MGDDDFLKYEKAQADACGPRLHAAMGAIGAFAGQIDRECANPVLEPSATMGMRWLLRDLLHGAWVLGYEYHCQEAAEEGAAS